MSKVKVSPQLLKKAASGADQAGQAIGSVKMLEGTPSVAAAMPGSRSGGAVVRAADFGDKMAKSRKTPWKPSLGRSTRRAKTTTPPTILRASTFPVSTAVCEANDGHVG